MTEQHRATEEQWAQMQPYLTPVPNPAVSSCILELRDRLAALEGMYETQRLATLEWGKDVGKLKRWIDLHLHRIEALEANSSAGLTSSSHPAKPDTSLVERVQRAVGYSHPDVARAAILAVAAWLREQGAPAAGWAMRLEQEAERG